MPACASASSRRRPAGPTNGAPSRSSRSPGCSPTNIATEPRLPAPNTVCVASSHSGQARHPAAASRSFGSDGREGTRSAAESAIPCAFPPSPRQSMRLRVHPHEGFALGAWHRCFVRLLRSTSGSFQRASELRSIGGSVVVRPSHLRLLDDDAPGGDPTLVESYRRLADVFHEVLAEQSLDALLVRIADTVGDLIPSLDTLTIYEADETKCVLRPVLVRDVYADEIMITTISFSEGVTGWATRHREAVLSNQAHLDPRVRTVPGTPMEPEALICVPLIARDQIKGALNIYREGDGVAFSDTEFEIAKRFGDAAALALDNAEIRVRLEHQARTDSLTGLCNHRAFHERLRTALAHASRAHEAVSVLMLDIDDFKRVNDIYGHGAGDEILRGLAETLKDAVRSSDAVYRLGGEEFAIVITSRSAHNAEE